MSSSNGSCLIDLQRMAESWTQLWGAMQKLVLGLFCWKLSQGHQLLAVGKVLQKQPRWQSTSFRQHGRDLHLLPLWTTERPRGVQEVFTSTENTQKGNCQKGRCQGQCFLSCLLHTRPSYSAKAPPNLRWRQAQVHDQASQ